MTQINSYRYRTQVKNPDGGNEVDYRWGAPVTKRAAMFNVMSFNARMDTTQPDGADGSDGPNAWPHRRELLAANIELAAPDLLGMQEVRGAHAEQPQHWWSLSTVPLPAERVDTCVAAC